MNKTKMAIDVFDKRAAEYQDKFMDISMYHNALDLFCTHLPRHNSELLDIACGPGNIAKYILGKCPGLKVLGIDLAPNMLTYAAANNPTAHFQLMDARDISTLSKGYGGIVCGFCLPYLSKEEAVTLINDAYGLLATNGVLYLSTMEDDYSKSGYEKSSKGDEVYIHYHEAGYLTQALEKAGFNILSVQHLDYRPENGVPTTDLAIISVK